MERLVLIIGNENLQNELVHLLLKEKLNVKCQITNKRNIEQTLRNKTEELSLVLWDCLCIDLNSPLLWHEIQYCSKNNQHMNALFNVNRENNIIPESIRRGIRGIFYDDDSTDHFIKGIDLILRGDLWYSRNSIIEYFANNYSNTNVSNHENANLTFREIEILKMLTGGSSNTKIADDLCISKFTVKTHIHNIYKKINAKSRLEAALWAAKNH